MIYYFLSNSDTAGGIAYNIKKITRELKKNGNSNCFDLYFNKYNKKIIKEIIFHKEPLTFFCTSAFTLFFACMIYIIRFFLFRRTFVSQIIYHPRFIDPTVSLFRKFLNKAIRLIPKDNIYYYSDECIYASKIEQYNNISDNNLIGLCSIYDDIESMQPTFHPTYSNFKRNDFEFVITTIGRLVDFKLGSILSLIKFAEENSNVALLIIGYGPSEELIKNKINNINNIYFLGKCSINESKYIVQHSDVYIGMGTTLVDAVSVSIPAIVAIESKNQGLTSGFFPAKSGINFGEFSKTTSYHNLIDFLYENINKKTIDNIKKNESDITFKTPWNKIENNFSTVRKIKLKNILLISIYIILSYFIRFFTKKDYH
ncbi:hypothetical protein ACPAVH_13610 [Enterobacteriaceae bacterium TYF_5]